MNKSINRVIEIYNEYTYNHLIKTDKIFFYVLWFQWIAITTITFLTDTAISLVSILLPLIPTYFLKKQSGGKLNMLLVTCIQFSYSVLITHATHGRLEGHFHIFVSLALLALYKQIQPIVLFTILTSVDHLLRVYFWPEPIYGALNQTQWVALEHLTWVLFEACILVYIVIQNMSDAKALSEKQFQIEETLNQVESIVNERTRDLEVSNQLVLEQQEKMIINSKMSALGEMASGVAHEVNTPLAVIQIQADQIRNIVEKKTDENSLKVTKMLDSIDSTLNRISKIVTALKLFSRDNSNDAFIKYQVTKIVEDVLTLCNERLKNRGIELTRDIPNDFDLTCRPVQISQVLLNIISNSCDAIENSNEKWITISAKVINEKAIISVTDSGTGIPQNIRDKVMQPFFTTKDLGKGTGLGLSISKGIINSHSGQIYIDAHSKNTKVVIELPIK